MTNFFAPVERGVQHAALRAANRRAVMTTISFNPGMSNADVSRHTGLAPQTASAIVTELEDEGMILRGEVLRGRRGQPATPLYLNHNAMFAIGCEVSWHHIDIVLVSLGMRQIGHYRRDYDAPDIKTVVAECAGAIADLVDRLTPEERERFAGIGIASPMASLEGIERPMTPSDLPLPWRDLDLRKDLAETTGFETFWFNDGNAAAWTEMLSNPTNSPNSFAYFFIDCSISSGIITGDSLWGTPAYVASNLGFMRVCDSSGQQHYGHDIASLCALSDRIGNAGLPMPNGNPMDWDWNAIAPQVDEWLDDSAQAFAELVLNAGAALGVPTVVIDGAIPRDILERLVSATQQKLAMKPAGPFAQPALTAGAQGQKAPALGAAVLTFSSRFYSRDASELGR
ncbi:ROK family transcriptional regulator [Devosia sp.]|uniref:ROK family transcriptional regulator n=1 Tax=Devosia sp. TaxID=1871048 RepID=UPI003A91C3BA